MALHLSLNRKPRSIRVLRSKKKRMFYAHKSIPMPGRLLVEVIQTDGTDDALGIVLPHAPADTVMARVIRTSDEEHFPEDSVVMYDRLHGKEITLMDTLQSPTKYKVIQTADVSLILLE